MAKQDGGRIRANIAMTRQAIANAQKRGIPKFNHPTRSKPASPVTEPPREEDADESAPTPESSAD